jgi:cell division protein FtsB
LLKEHQDLEVQLSALWSSTSKTSTNNKAYTSRVSVETYYDQITQENDHLEREVKKLELEVNKLKNQAKVQPPQDNRNNMVKKLEKEKIHQRLPLNHQRSKFKRRGLKKWNM